MSQSQIWIDWLARLIVAHAESPRFRGRAECIRLAQSGDPTALRALELDRNNREYAALRGELTPDVCKALRLDSIKRQRELQIERVQLRRICNRDRLAARKPGEALARAVVQVYRRAEHWYDPRVYAHVEVVEPGNEYAYTSAYTSGGEDFVGVSKAIFSAYTRTTHQGVVIAPGLRLHHDCAHELTLECEDNGHWKRVRFEVEPPDTIAPESTGDGSRFPQPVHVPFGAVGPLSVLRRAAELARSKKIRTALQRYVETLERCPPGRRKTVTAAMRIREPWLHKLPPTHGCPDVRLVQESCGYPTNVEIAARIVLGESPAQISGGLTRKEAHLWLTEAPYLDPQDWLVRHYCPGRRIHVHSVHVARWLVGALNDPPRARALLRHRAEIGPHGEEIRGCWLDRVDELRDKDLCKSVDETFRRAGERMYKHFLRIMKNKDERLAAAPHWWRAAPCARILLTGAQLVSEGYVMDHCVAQYAGYVKSGQSVIVAINVLGQRSTVELDPETADVRQHRGRGNEVAPELCRRALAVLRRRWRAVVQERERKRSMLPEYRNTITDPPWEAHNANR